MQRHFDIEPDFLKLFELCRADTMTTLERMHALWLATRYIARNNIPGDFVECGVWRGGSMMLAALALMQCGDTRRHLWLFDTYAGMSNPTEDDKLIENTMHASQLLDAEAPSLTSHIWALAPKIIVRDNMITTGYPMDRVHMIEGLVEETIPAAAPKRIALLRLDTDWYESTRHELIHLWPLVVSGGVMIIDDYGAWAGCRKAVDEFFATLTMPPLLVRIDEARICVKL